MAEKHNVISNILAILFFVAMLFVRIPYLDVNEAIMRYQIEYPLPQETKGIPEFTSEGSGRLVPISSHTEAMFKQLKITKRDGGFYWDSWNGQKLDVLRGYYTVNGKATPSTLFISQRGDGMIHIFNETTSSKAICNQNRANKSAYKEIRSPIVTTKNEVITGHLENLYPNGVDFELCKENALGLRMEMYFRPSLLQVTKEFLSKRSNKHLSQNK